LLREELLPEVLSSSLPLLLRVPLEPVFLEDDLPAEVLRLPELLRLLWELEEDESLSSSSSSPEELLLPLLFVKLEEALREEREVPFPEVLLPELFWLPDVLPSSLPVVFFFMILVLVKKESA